MKKKYQVEIKRLFALWIAKYKKNILITKTFLSVVRKKPNAADISIIEFLIIITLLNNKQTKKKDIIYGHYMAPRLFSQ